MAKKTKASKKAYLIFGIFLIILMVFVSIMDTAPEPAGNTDEIQTFANQEIDLQNLSQYPFGQSLETILKEIGVDDAVEAVCEVDNSFGMTLRVVTNSKRLWIGIDDYFQEKREVLWVKDYDSDHTLYYYISNDLNYNEPIFSYTTGELLVDKVDGESSTYPIKITATQLVNEINSDIDSAKQRYNGKWVEITGEITFVSKSAGMTGYYLHGYGGSSGLKITCWVYDNNAVNLSVGDTATFIGTMREVTIMNNTEIGDCKYIK